MHKEPLSTHGCRLHSRTHHHHPLDGLECAQADGLAVAVHGSFGSRMPGFSRGRYDDNLFMEHMIAHPFGQMAVMMDLIAGGVMDRFPQLRVGFFESGLGWIPYWLDRLDDTDLLPYATSKNL